MPVKLLSLLVLGCAVLVGCGDGADPPAPVVLPVPAAGRYQATLVGYSARTCDEALGSPAGTLETAAEFGFLDEGSVRFSGGLVWPFGAVPLRPGDPKDSVARLSWVGTATVRPAWRGCKLAASVTVQYFPTDATRGSLHARPRYGLFEGGCPLRLPCEDHAIWSLESFR